MSRLGWDTKVYKFGNYEVLGLTDYYLQILCEGGCGKASGWVINELKKEIRLYCLRCGHQGEWMKIEESIKA